MVVASRIPIPGADRRFRLAVGAYVGTLIAGAATVVAAVTGGSAISLVATGWISLASGLAIGFGLAGRVADLPGRLGRSRRVRAGLAAPAAGVGAIGVGPVVTEVDASVTVVGFAAALAVVLTGWIVGTMARTRYVGAITESDPVMAVSWNPPGSARADLVLLALALLLGLSSAYGGNWTMAILWTGFAAIWSVSSVLEGRWRFGHRGHAPELRVHEAGLEKRRPCSRSFVTWDEVEHVRLMDGELVLDRGLFDVRFDGTQLDDPGAILDSIERASPIAVRR